MDRHYCVDNWYIGFLNIIICLRRPTAKRYLTLGYVKLHKQNNICFFIYYNKQINCMLVVSIFTIFILFLFRISFKSIINYKCEHIFNNNTYICETSSVQLLKSVNVFFFAKKNLTVRTILNTKVICNQISL